MNSDRNRIRVGQWVFDRRNSTISSGVEIRRLKSRLADTLSFLIAHRDQVVSKEELMRGAWKTVVSDNAITRVIGRLRQVLGDDSQNPEYIYTVQGRGYRLIAHCSDVDDPAQVSRPELDRRYIFWLLALGVVAAVLVVWLSKEPGDKRKIKSVAQTSTLTALRGDETDPAINPAGSMLAFAHRRIDEDWWNIYIQDMDSGMALQVTHSEFNDRLPSWSHSGDKLIFKRVRYQQCEIYAIEFNEGFKQFREYKVKDCDATALYSGVIWGAEDQTIYYAASESVDDPMRLYQYNLMTANITQLTSPPNTGRGDFRYSLSPDQTCLAFLRNVNEEAGVDLWCYYLDTAETVLLHSFENRVRHIAWGNDPSVILFTGADGQIQALDLDSGDNWSLTNSLEPLFYPASSGGKLVAGSGSLYKQEIWKLSGDFSKAAPESVQRHLWIASSRSDGMPRVNPVDDSIAFVSTRSGLRQVWIKTAEDERQLTQFEQAYPIGAMEWSPDGSWLLIVSNNSLYQINAATGEHVLVFASPADIAHPVWAADGQTILFAQQFHGDWQIVRYDPASGETLQVSTEGGYRSLQLENGDLYVSKYQTPGLYRVRSGENDSQDTSTETLNQDLSMSNWHLSPSADAVYYVSLLVGSRLIRQELTRSFDQEVLLDIGQDIILDMEIASDLQSIYYSRFRRDETDIVLIQPDKP